MYNVDKSIPNEHSFYFRLSGTNLYYTTTPTDMNVLGAISIVNIEDVSPSLSAI
jgi:hypothetical protein